MSNEWKLFWVEEESEVYAARSLEEAVAFVEKCTGEKVTPDMWGEFIPPADLMGWDDGAGEKVNMAEEWERTKAEGIAEPVQFWTGYL